MEGSKIRLSLREQELMRDAEIILTKNKVLQKVQGVMEELMQQQMDWKNDVAPDHPSFLVSPKISRGELYEGLPWMVLDYPRISKGGQFFFIRSLFWWGRCFSSTLHLAADSREAAMPRILEAREKLQAYSICINEDPWQHHFREDNYKRIDSLNEDEWRKACLRWPHIKIGRAWPLQQWDEAPALWFDSWQELWRLASVA